MGSKTARNILVILLGFLSAGALGGGITFIVSPSGALMHMPLSNLDGSPFSNFLVPGIILFLVLGVLPAILAWALLKKPDSRLADRFNFISDMHWAWSFTIYTVFALAIWIQVEMIVLQSVHWLQSFYMFYAMAILFFALLPQVRWMYAKGR